MIRGNIYDNMSSANKIAELHILENRFIIKVDEIILYEGDLSNLNISSRIGNIKRTISLTDVFTFVTKENDLVDTLILKKIKKSNLIYTLETKISLILLSLMITVLISFSFIKWGIPYISEKIAYSLPIKVNNVIASNTLNIFDNQIFTKSKISKAKKEAIRKKFQNDILKNITNKENFNYKINFREWKYGKENIANAFALPNGDIILTDHFINLSSNLDEISSVLLHEIAHIKYRHGLQNIISRSFIAVIITSMIGDIEGIADIAVGFSSLLINNGYSREFESQADLYAFEMMLKLNIDPINFSNILSKISKEDENILNDTNLSDYFSSHPNTNKRNKIANIYSNCFKENLKVCKEY